MGSEVFLLATIYLSLGLSRGHVASSCFTQHTDICHIIVAFFFKQTKINLFKRWMQCINASITAMNVTATSDNKEDHFTWL